MELNKEFWAACLAGNLEEVKRLAPEVDVNWWNPEDGGTALAETCSGPHTEQTLPVIKFLLTLPQLDVNHTDHHDFTPLFVACCQGQVEVVEVLVRDPRTDPNRQTQAGQSPLLRACYNGCLATVEWLLASPHLINTKAVPDYGPFCQMTLSAIVVEHSRLEDHPIIALLEAYEQDHEKTRRRLQRKLGWTP